MNSALSSPTPAKSETAGTAKPELSLFRLYTLRICYFILAAGLGTFIWPSVIHHSSEFAIAQGIRYALLAGLGATALLGFRHTFARAPGG